MEQAATSGRRSACTRLGAQVFSFFLKQFVLLRQGEQLNARPVRLVILQRIKLHFQLFISNLQCRADSFLLAQASLSIFEFIPIGCKAVNELRWAL